VKLSLRTDSVLARYLATDLMLAEAERRLPLPPRLPSQSVFPSTERETVRPPARPT